MVYKVNNVKQFVYLPKVLLKIFLERSHDKRKENQGSNPKSCHPEEAPQDRSPQDMSLYESFDFSEEVIDVAKIAFSLERLYGMIFLTEFGRTFFPGVFFSKAKEKTYREKTPQKHSL